MKDNWWFSVLPALCFIIAHFIIFLVESNPKIIIIAIRVHTNNYLQEP
jgi:hypothetical protein